MHFKSSSKKTRELRALIYRAPSSKFQPKNNHVEAEVGELKANLRSKLPYGDVRAYPPLMLVTYLNSWSQPFKHTKLHFKYFLTC